MSFPACLLIYGVLTAIFLLFDGFYQERRRERARQLSLHDEVVTVVRRYTDDVGDDGSED
jgi:hypothetical protein